MKTLLKKITLVLLAVIMFTGSAVTVFATEKIDNSGFLKYKTYAETDINISYTDGLLRTPDWVDSLIIVEVRPDTASIGGTFAESYDLLDFYAELGVNGIWLSPVYDKGIGNGYSNCGPHTIDSSLTGKDNYEDGWQELAKFVKYAHSKGIYVFLDVITWGVVKGAPIIEEHPDWFDGEAWGNIAFDWSNEELTSWFTDTLINNILVTDADGFRCDCEPYYTGYDLYGNVKNALADMGKNIIVICEDTCKRSGVYDFEQEGIFDYATTSRGEVYSEPVNFFGDGLLNIVDCVKSGSAHGFNEWQNNALKRGTGQYYTNCITNHDYQRRDVCGSRINIGYSAIFAPYIPIWYMGDEFNAYNEHGVLYDFPVDFSEAELPANKEFLNDVKKMIQIRRTYSDIFEYWPTNHRNSNICKVEAEGFGTLQAYARYAGNKAVIIVANNKNETVTGTVNIPFADTGINLYSKYTVTDLMTGEIVVKGTKTEVKNFAVTLKSEYVGAYLVEGTDATSNVLINIQTLLRKIPEFIYSELLDFISIFSSAYC